MRTGGCVGTIISLGFKSSPYNSIHTFLVTEEIIWGDRHDRANAFQWEYTTMNLLGTSKYTPSKAWILKRRLDNSFASNFVCFVDDQWITGVGRQRLDEARHAISTRESYLGIQDALRKIRAAKGSCHLGVWARANACVEDEGSIFILTSQEK